MNLGPWQIGFAGFGEILPEFNNKVFLSKTEKDPWGIPSIVLSAQVNENELKMRNDMEQDSKEMLEKIGAKNILVLPSKYIFGSCIHEMGTARMGRDPKTSVLNSFNQVWDAKNVFVTDGACMTSSSCVNPSLTYMALTARACHYAVEELKKGNL